MKKLLALLLILALTLPGCVWDAAPETTFPSTTVTTPITFPTINTDDATDLPTEDPYVGMTKEEFYANYTPAANYVDASYRSQHGFQPATYHLRHGTCERVLPNLVYTHLRIGKLQGRKQVRESQPLIVVKLSVLGSPVCIAWVYGPFEGIL